MRGYNKTAFCFALLVLFLAVLIVQPRSSAQLEQSPFIGQLEGGGYTRDPKKLNSRDSVSFAQDLTLERADVESGLVPLDDEVTTSIISINPTLPGGVDHVAAGTGTRNAGNGTIRLRGVPTGSTVVRAWLYWGTVYANPAPLTATAVFNGTMVTGKRINAPTPEPCWLFQNASFAAYRATVKSLVTSNVNGNYQVSGLASAITNGTDPFVCSPPFAFPPTPGSEGATLVVIFSHPSVPSRARTYIHEGPTLVTGTTIVTNNLSPAVPLHTFVKQTRFGADGQIGCSTFSIPALNGEITSFGPNLLGLTIIKGPGSTLNPSSDWAGADGTCMNQLWDTQSDGFGSVNGMSSILPTGATQYVVQYTGVGDCFVTVAHILTVK